MDYKNYPVEVKLKAVQMYLEGVSTQTIVEEMGLKNRGRLYEWTHKYRLDGDKGLEDHRGYKNKSRKTEEEQSMEERLLHLELENHHLKKLLELQRG